MRRGGVTATLAASPTMVGAITVLIVIVAVFLAYNANSGLPFVPSYKVSAEIPNAASLVPGNEVRVGGVRVGLIESIEPVSDENGSVSARLNLKLDPDVEPIPTDSTMIVRARSALGLKYLEIVRGTSGEGYAAGSVIPITAARPEPVEFDDVLSTFDDPTRLAIRANLVEFGNALAGRGIDLNAALGQLPDTVEVLEPVLRNLGAPETRLERFVVALAAAAAEVAPVAEDQAQMFVALETTFGSLAGVARPYVQETISESPPTLDQATESLPRIRPFLTHSAALFTELEPGVDALAANAPAIADALAVGAPVLRAAPAFNRELPPTAAALRVLNDDAEARTGIDRLVQTAGLLTPTLRFVGPAQTVCNYGSVLFDNAASVFSQRPPGAPGTWQRFEVIYPPAGPNNEGSPSSAPANGGGGAGNFLHVNPYPNTAAPGQERECEAGNEPYIAGSQQFGNVPGNQGTITRELEGAP